MAFTDLHEIEEMFGRLEGQTSGLTRASFGGYYVCHGPETRDRNEYKRKWMAAKRKERGWRALEKRRVPEVRKASGRKKQAAYKARSASPKRPKRSAEEREAIKIAQKARGVKSRAAQAEALRLRLDAERAVDDGRVDGAGKGR